MKKLLVALVIALLVGVGIAESGEQLDLTTPINISAYRVVGLNLNKDGTPNIIIYLRTTTTNDLRVENYVGDDALNLIKAMNKADCSVKSLERRILEKLVADGKLDGTVSGIPD